MRSAKELLELQMTSRFLAVPRLISFICMKPWKGLERAGIKLNWDKCIVKSTSYTFFGNIYTLEGIKPDPSKIDAIKWMDTPSTKQELVIFGYGKLSE